MLTNCSPNTEIVGVGQLPIVLDLLAFDADVGDPVLTTAVGASGDVQLKLLVEFWNALFELVHQPASEPFCLGYGEFAKFSSRTGDGAAPEGAGFDFEADRVEFVGKLGRLVVGDVDEEQDSARQLPEETSLP